MFLRCSNFQSSPFPCPLDRAHPFSSAHLVKIIVKFCLALPCLWHDTGMRVIVYGSSDIQVKNLRHLAAVNFALAQGCWSFRHWTLGHGSKVAWLHHHLLLCDEHVEIVLVNQLLRRNMIGPNAQELLVCLRLHLVFHEPHQSCFRFVLRILGHPWLVTRDKCWTAQRLPYLQWDVSFC